MPPQIRRYFLILYFSIGIALTIAAPFLAGDATLPPVIADVEEGEMFKTYRSEQIATNSASYADENRNASPDEFSLGIAAFTIASFSEDPAWSKEASKHFSAVRADTRNELPLNMAYRGAANALMARDYPVNGFWLVFPGPGFVRIYHVYRAKTLLNQAVETAPDDPIVLLIRATTFTNMPGIFGTKNTGFADFARLTEIVASGGNDDGVSDSPAFGAQMYMSYARALEANERLSESVAVWKTLAETFPDMPEAVIAAEHAR